jgi:hypothetical protein
MNQFEFLKERKRLRDELLWERRRKAMPGLELLAKTQPPKTPRNPSPLPGEFIEALSGSEHHKGFDQAWLGFVRNDGPTALKNLADKGANLNFIFSLFNYLWNENVSPREHKSANVQHWRESLEAIRKVKDIYKQFITKVPGLETFVDAENFELALLGIEENIGNFLNAKDFRSPGGKRSPDDKINRVIFTLYEYLKQKTGGPHWQTFLDLLVASGAIKKGIKKSRKNDLVTDNPDR